MSSGIRAYLGMKYELVGIKINKGAEDTRPEEPKSFCQLVKEASLGKEFSIEIEDLACPNAELCLGFREPKYVEVEPRIKEHVERVSIGKVTSDSDVILCVLNPEQIMTMSILLGGITPTFKGELGVCGEAVAKVYNDNKPNVTFLCNGARLFGGFRENELLLALPKDCFWELEKRIEGLLKTGGSLCGCRVSDIPNEVTKSFKQIGFEKGADYFFGKIEDKQVRIYLNKDESGRFKYLTFYLPMKDLSDEIEVLPPFQKRQRGNWTDIYGVFDPTQLGISLYTGKNMLKVLGELAKKALRGKG